MTNYSAIGDEFYTHWSRTVRQISAAVERLPDGIKPEEWQISSLEIVQNNLLNWRSLTSIEGMWLSRIRETEKDVYSIVDDAIERISDMSFSFSDEEFPTNGKVKIIKPMIGAGSASAVLFILLKSTFWAVSVGGAIFGTLLYFGKKSNESIGLNLINEKLNESLLKYGSDINRKISQLELE